MGSILNKGADFLNAKVALAYLHRCIMSKANYCPQNWGKAVGSVAASASVVTGSILTNVKACFLCEQQCSSARSPRGR